MEIGVALSRDPDGGIAAAEAADGAAQGLRSGSCRLAVVFASDEHLDALPGAVAAIEARLSPDVVIGGVASGIVGPGREVEDGPALAVWAGSWRDGTAEAFRSRAVRDPAGGMAVVGWPPVTPADTTIILADPTSYPAGEVVAHLGEIHPGHRVVGGMLTPGHRPGRVVVSGDGGRAEVHDGGAVGVVLRGVDVRTVVSQGCRPVGEPFVVTRAEGHLVLELAGAPATERLREVFAEASPEDRRLMRTGLHVGIVADEYRDRFATGDFLIRAVLGADDAAGSIAVGDHVAVGRTIQFQVRDAASAHQDLRAALERDGSAAAGALLFTCNGRGRRFFGEGDHDARLVGEALTRQLAGAFCAGEIGPVGDRSFLHGFTASLAVFGAPDVAEPR